MFNEETKMTAAMRPYAICDLIPVGSVLNGSVKWRGEVWSGKNYSQRLVDVTRTYSTTHEVKAEAERIAARAGMTLIRT